jgi:hypothetical protein
MQLAYLIGEPGVGKTTLLHEFTKGLQNTIVDRPFGHVLYEQPGVVELGKPRAGGFGGTDSLSMSVQPKVLEWAQLPEYPNIIGEGDRLANNKFFAAMTALGYDLTVVEVRNTNGVAEERRAARAAQLGTKAQNDSWVAGRVTKVRKLADDWATIHIPAHRPLFESVSILRGFPVFDRLWEAAHNARVPS